MLVHDGFRASTSVYVMIRDVRPRRTPFGTCQIVQNKFHALTRCRVYEIFTLDENMHPGDVWLLALIGHLVVDKRGCGETQESWSL